MKSHQLLKFKKEEACLAKEGLDLVRSLQGPVCPVIFIGDGRSGKSYLASKLLGVEDVFVSSDSAEPVTEGIDIVATPVDALLATGGESTASPPASEGEHLLILDCEGGNNAMAAIRTLVNVFGILLGTEVVFVANGMASEQALQNLGASLAARSLIRLDGEKLLEQQLIFVVNKNTLRYNGSELEKILDQKHDDPARQELRDVIRHAFPQRHFAALPLLGMPNFEEEVQSLRSKILERRAPLTIGGSEVRGPQLCGLLELVVREVQRSNEVSFPSMNRFVIYDGFLAPIVKRLVEEGKQKLPILSDYDEDLSSKAPHKTALATFDQEVAHVVHKGLVQEARDKLVESLDGLWREVERSNDVFGEQTKEVRTETREVCTEKSRSALGGKGLLKNVCITKKKMVVENRAVIHKKKGGEPECSQWESTGALMTRFEESAFEQVASLPILKARVNKKSPNVMRSLLMQREQERICMVRDGHFLWWDAKNMSNTDEAKGCINFLVHSAEVEADPSSSTSFLIRPKTAWDHQGSPQTFTGGSDRKFYFDTGGRPGEVSRDDWVAALRKHIDFCRAVREQITEEKAMKLVPICKPTLLQVET